MVVYDKHGQPLKESTKTEQITKTTPEDIKGYNANALKIYLQMAGFQGGIRGLSDALGLSYQICYKKIHTGRFTRLNIMALKEALSLTPAQLCDIFFNDGEGVGKDCDRVRF